MIYLDSWTDFWTKFAPTLVAKLTPALAFMALIVLGIFAMAAMTKSRELGLYGLIFGFISLVLVLILGASVGPAAAYLVVAILLIVVVLLVRQVMVDPPADARTPSFGDLPISDITFLLGRVIEDFNLVLSIDATKIRAHVFAKTRTALIGPSWLRIVPELTVGPMSADEGTLKLKPGTGVTGVAFKQKRIYNATFNPAAPRGGTVWLSLDPNEARKVDPNLCWVAATPITRAQPRFAFSVDGLERVDATVLDQTAAKVFPRWENLIAKALSDLKWQRR